MAPTQEQRRFVGCGEILYRTWVPPTDAYEGPAPELPGGDTEVFFGGICAILPTGVCRDDQR